jgi:hypothetical protein
VKRIGLVAIVLSAIVFGTALSARAQAGEDARMPVPPTPPAPGNLPDFNGVWVLPYTPDLTRAYGGPLPFTPFGAQQFKDHLGGDDPHGFCQPTGPSRAFHSPFPFEIVQYAGMTTILFEIDHNFMRIFTDGRGHPDDLDPQWWGHAIGKYEGNELIVDIAGISDRSWLDTAGHQHSDKMHLTEVFEKTGADTISWTVTIDDPVYFTKPWSVTLKGRREKYDIMEMICTDNNRDIPHYITSESLKKKADK